MSKAGGFVLVLAGLAAAAYVLPSADTGDGDFLHFTEVAKTLPSRIPVASPALAPRVAAASETPPVAKVELTRPADAKPSFSTPVVVTIAQRANEPSGMLQQATSVPRDRDGIGRELQKELKRVGCYEGELNGAWTPATKQAMRAFTDRVNATLPIEEPDSILLTLVRAHADRVCGKPCPPGQGLSDSGRCLPSAILARANSKPAPTATTASAAAPEKPVPVITGWSTTTTAAANPPLGSPPTEGRMALAGPTPPAGPGAADGTSGAVPPAATPPATPPKRTAERSPSGQGSWARNLFRMQASQN
jgi:hypothetical protein